MNEPVKYLVDTASLSVWISALLGVVPNIAAIMSVVWLGFRIYETYLSIKIKQREL